MPEIWSSPTTPGSSRPNSRRGAARRESGSRWTSRGRTEPGTPWRATPVGCAPATCLDFDREPGLQARVEGEPSGGAIVLRFNKDGPAFARALDRAGALALPPYIARPGGPTADDAKDYQTVFAREAGAVAAPTAGLHFTPEVLAALDGAGVARTTVTLHVGAGTFLPMRGSPDHHVMHAERGEITPAAAELVNRAGRVVAVGTTTLRLLESAALLHGAGTGRVTPFRGDTSLFIRPGFRFRAVDLLLTNFHLPRSTLFMLVCAFAGTERMRAAYAHAVAARYRFYSYGDASLLDRARGPPC